ncbi:agmatine/peptidylarginine deiminase [Acidiferrobacter sp.]|uniref:agmatine deiminase family protein n=1 Tax=Acidiferrobacter sp. TaxID=1872107 RepID=UPI00261F375A|nr:agmatine deiminase family protein [Acidiferrobacter sp.]
MIPIRRHDRTTAVHRFPAEWEPQSGVMITWPHAYGDWAPVLDEASSTFAAIAAAITRHERVLIVAYDTDHEARIRTALKAARVDGARVRIVIAPSDDVFVRDHGPLAVEGAAGPILQDFAFNGWGRKYAYARDDALTRTLHAQGVFGTTPLESTDFVLEGGSVESDGAGTLLVTARCLLSPARNPKYGAAEIEALLAERLAARRVLWLHHGYLAGDDTDGHIDTLARFCDPQTIAYCACPWPDDEHYGELKAMERELQALRTISGAPYRLVALPWPSAKLDVTGERMPATYANFLIINGAVLVPLYADRQDHEALQVIGGCFPGREIIGIPSLALIAQHGSLHCATLQLPPSVLA